MPWALIRKCGPTSAAEAGHVRRARATRSSEIKVISPGPAISTGRASPMGTLPSPTTRPFTIDAICSRVADAMGFSSVKIERGVFLHPFHMIPVR